MSPQRTIFFLPFLSFLFPPSIYVFQTSVFLKSLEVVAIPSSLIARPWAALGSTGWWVPVPRRLQGCVWCLEGQAPGSLPSTLLPTRGRVPGARAGDPPLPVKPSCLQTPWLPLPKLLGAVGENQPSPRTLLPTSALFWVISIASSIYLPADSLSSCGV